jgi:hypothetical protein
MQARFHKYSFSNTMLILGQRPTATRVAGFRTWQQLGRHVQRGQQAIWILAPVVTRPIDEQPDATELEPPTRRVLVFRAVPVFAEDQTSGTPLPEVCRRLTGDDPRGLYEALVQVGHDVGFSVADHAFDSETNGDCSPELHARSPSQTWRTFLRNRAHHLWAADLFTMPTLTFKTLCVLVFIGHGRRELVHVNVTAHPTSAWVWRQ